MKTDEQIDMEILSDEITDLEKRIEALQLALKKKREQKAMMQSAFKVADVIEWKHGRKGQMRKGYIASIAPYGASYKYNVVSIRADGSYGSGLTVYPTYQNPKLVAPQHP